MREQTLFLHFKHLTFSAGIFVTLFSTQIYAADLGVTLTLVSDEPSEENREIAFRVDVRNTNETVNTIVSPNTIVKITAPKFTSEPHWTTFADPMGVLKSIDVTKKCEFNRLDCPEFHVGTMQPDTKLFFYVYYTFRFCPNGVGELEASVFGDEPDPVSENNKNRSTFFCSDRKKSSIPTILNILLFEDN